MMADNADSSHGSDEAGTAWVELEANSSADVSAVAAVLIATKVMRLPQDHVWQKFCRHRAWDS